MGGALGLSILSTVAVAAAGSPASGYVAFENGPDPAFLASQAYLVPGYAMAFRVSAGVLVAASVLMLLWLPKPVRRTG